MCKNFSDNLIVTYKDKKLDTPKPSSIKQHTKLTITFFTLYYYWLYAYFC